MDPGMMLMVSASIIVEGRRSAQSRVPMQMLETIGQRSDEELDKHAVI